MGSAMQILMSGPEHTIKQAQVEASRMVQESGNERSAAEASLSNFAQALGNQRKLNAVGKNDEALQRNIAKLGESMTAGKFQDRIAAATALGEVTAMAGAAGVGGSSIETYKRTMMLRQAIGEESQARALGNDKINYAQRRGQALEDAVAGMNQTTYVGAMDRTVYMDHQKIKNVLGAAIAVGVASYFGGPQAGMATSDAIAGANSMANGNQNAANNYFNSSAQGFIQAGSNYQKTNGNPWGMSGGGGTDSLANGWKSFSDGFSSMFSIGGGE